MLLNVQVGEVLLNNQKYLRGRRGRKEEEERREGERERGGEGERLNWSQHAKI